VARATQEDELDIEIRHPNADEIELFHRRTEMAFGEDYVEGTAERWAPLLDTQRMYMAVDGDDLVGTAADFAFTLTVPGGKVEAAGVTMVGVLPSHRRRGILTRMMRRQLDNVRQRGEPVAILWASEGNIYQRFGYGIATLYSLLDIDRDRARFRNDPGRSGRLRMLEPEKTVETIADVYNRVCDVTPGMYERSREWWEATRLHDPPEHREGGGPMFRAVWEKDGRPEAYALYRLHDEWETEPMGHVRVIEAMGTTPEATREIWRFLLNIDLVARIKGYAQPGIPPLLFMVAEPRRLRARLSDALLVRLVDVRAALEARSYAAEGTVVFEVADAFMPDNAGRWRLEVTNDGTSVECTTDPADLIVDASDLGCVYLGGFTFAQLLQGGQIEEASPGSAWRADGMFRTEREPWCPQVF
jgi:predicted acetyltransferase